MSRWIFVVLLLACLTAGCGGDKNKNINRNSDRPRSDDKTAAPQPKK